MEVAGVFPETVVEYAMWTNPARSAAVFGVGTFAWFLIVVKQYSVLTLVSYSALLYLLICFSYVNAIHIWSTYTQPNAKSQLRKHLFPDDETWLEISTSEQYHEALVKVCNKSLRFGRDIVYCRDNLQTLKALGVSFALAVIGWFVDVIAFLYLVFFLGMTLPMAYSLFPEPFDNALSEVKSRIPATYEDLIPLIPVLRTSARDDGKTSALRYSTGALLSDPTVALFLFSWRDSDDEEDDEEAAAAFEGDGSQQQEHPSNPQTDAAGKPHPLADIGHDVYEE